MTIKESRVLEYVRDRITADGVCPSYQEIAVAIGLSDKSKSCAYRIVRCLEARGHLHRLPGRARAIALGPKLEAQCPHCHKPVWWRA